MTLGGLILDFELAPANCDDLHVGLEILQQHRDLQVLGDKGYVSQPITEYLLEHNQVELKTLPRSNQKQGITAQARREHNHFRQVVSTVNGQLSEQLNIEQNYVYSFWSLCSFVAPTPLLPPSPCRTMRIHFGACVAVSIQS